MTTRYLLDTNICIYIAKQKPIQVLKRFEKSHHDEVAMSSITYGELLYGAEKSQHARKTREMLEALVQLIPALPLTADVSQHYGHIRCYLEKHGKIIGNNDLWIAAHACAFHLTLVTNNTREFDRVPHLKVENWV